jgi:hypothetical protein
VERLTIAPPRALIPSARRKDIGSRHPDSALHLLVRANRAFGNRLCDGVERTHGYAASHSEQGIEGSCQWPSCVLYDLAVLTAAASGNASSTIAINDARPVSSANNWYVAIDENATLNPNYFMPMSCGHVVVG